MTRSPPALAVVASTTQRLAVLLAAGVSPASAWNYLSTPLPPGSRDIPGDLIAATAGRASLEAQAWRSLAAAWSIASDAGAPLAPSLRDYAASLRDTAQVQRDIDVALAGPVATARLVMALPSVGVLFGLALGFNTVGTLFTTIPGGICLLVGVGLMIVAWAWNRRMVRAAQPRDVAPGIECDLMAIALSGGGALDRARESLASALDRFGLRADLGRLDDVLLLSRSAGVPAAELLRAEADEARRAARAEAQRAAASLAVRLMIPLGLCVLPAFMALGVFPLMLAVVSSTVSTF